MTERPVVFHHIAIAARRIADAPSVLVEVLGGRPHLGAVPGPFAFAHWRFSGGGCLEILEPRGPDGFLHRFLTQRGPGIHHVTFKVPSLAEACRRAEAHGYRIVGYADSNPGWKEAFLHPREALGIVVQFAETAAGGTPPPRLPLPEGPANPPPPAMVLGLRLRARSRNRAERQWAEVAGGASEECGGELAYRWPGSPLRLIVEIDPAAEEGPVCIEVAADRPLALPAQADPLLGTVFVQRPAPTR